MAVIIKRKHVELCVIIFFAFVIAVVFQQIFTSLAEQGIATGGPYDNAAARHGVLFAGGGDRVPPHCST